MAGNLLHFFLEKRASLKSIHDFWDTLFIIFWKQGGRCMSKEIKTKTYLEIFEEMLNEVKVFEVKDTYEAWEIMQYGFLQDLLLFAVEKECMSEMLAIAVEEYIVWFLDEKNPRLDEVEEA